MRREASIERRPRLATGTSAFAKPKIKARVEGTKLAEAKLGL